MYPRRGAPCRLIARDVAGGWTVGLSNRNGLVDVEGVDRDTIAVTGERVARSVTEAGARELLPRNRISTHR